MSNYNPRQNTRFRWKDAKKMEAMAQVTDVTGTKVEFGGEVEVDGNLKVNSQVRMLEEVYVNKEDLQDFNGNKLIKDGFSLIIDNTSSESASISYVKGDGTRATHETPATTQETITNVKVVYSIAPGSESGAYAGWGLCLVTDEFSALQIWYDTADGVANAGSITPLEDGCKIYFNAL